MVTTEREIALAPWPASPLPHLCEICIDYMVQLADVDRAGNAAFDLVASDDVIDAVYELHSELEACYTAHVCLYEYLERSEVES